MTFVKMNFNGGGREMAAHQELGAAAALTVAEHQTLTTGQEQKFALWVPRANAYEIFLRGAGITFLPMEGVHGLLRRVSNTVQEAGQNSHEVEMAALNTTLDQIEGSVEKSEGLVVPSRDWSYRSLDLGDSLLGLMLRPDTGGAFDWRVSKLGGRK
jgi:hypothetical protein